MAYIQAEILNAFVDVGLRNLKPAEGAVWLVLFRDAKPDPTARTAVDDIARRAGINRRTVLRSLKRLGELRMLRVIRRGGLRKGPSVYAVFPCPAPEQWDASTAVE